MAKVNGPLMSMEASGTYGGTLTFGRRKGVNVVRQRVTPADPKTAGQEAARNRLRTGGVLQVWANATTLELSGYTGTDAERLAAAAPSNSTWNAYLVQIITGRGGLTYTAARSAYAALTAQQKTAWTDAAGALTPALGGAAQTEAGGGQITPLTAGEVFFIYQYGLASVGLAASPTGTPPTYA